MLFFALVRVLNDRSEHSHRRAAGRNIVEQLVMLLFGELNPRGAARREQRKLSAVV